MKITRLKITNYRGIAALEASIPPAGAILAGKNRAGKTSVLRAIRAALAAQDIGPDAVRLDAKNAEIIIDLDAVTVRRAITGRGSTLSVTNRDGDKKASPQGFLNDLLGGSPLDPLNLFLAPKKERRSLILAALPVRVTLEQLRAWAPDLGAEHVFDGHGLEVLARVRTLYYDRRTKANAEARAAGEALARLSDAARSQAAEVPAGASEDLAGAAEATAWASAALFALQVQDNEAKCAVERTKGARERVAKLRASAEAERSAAPADAAAEVAAAAKARFDVARAREAELSEQLKAAENERDLAETAIAHFEEVITRRTMQLGRAAELERQAADLETVAALASVQPVAPSALEAASEALARAQEDERAVGTARAAAAGRAQAEQAAANARRAEAEAERLDKIVRALTDEAPAALLKSAASIPIPGLAIDGDDVLLDGKRLDALSGSEQMRFAVEVARRLNAKSKILVCDGLERLDPEQIEQFVAFATADGFQLLASRVAAGELILESLEIEQPKEASA